MADMIDRDNETLNTAPEFSTSERELNFVIRRWVKVPKTPALKEHIKELEQLLPALIRYTQFANLEPGEIGFTDEERAHVIDLLETTLAVLKAPLVEEGLLAETRSSLSRALTRLGQEAPEKVLYVSGALVIEHLDKLLKLLGV